MSIEIMKKKMEYSRVRVAREELELKIAINLDDVQRLQELVRIQEAKEAELLQQIEELSKK